MEAAIVFDIGGTYIRAGVYTEQKELKNIIKKEVPNFLKSEIELQELQNLLVNTIYNITKTLSNHFDDLHIKTLGIGFPGPIGSKGEVLKAPSIWGNIKNTFPLKQKLRERLQNYKIIVLNDLTASGWRYIDLFDGSFCLFTIGSGVGCKVFKNSKVLLNNNGYGGEIGHHHWGIDYTQITCDCGEKGHIAGISSGRGVLRIHEIFKKRAASIFDHSLLKKCKNPTTKDLVAAVKKQDEYALLLIKESIRPIASSISNLYAFIGIDRFIVMGGFAIALGDIYIHILREELRKARMFGINDNVNDMVTLAKQDDYHGLIGMGTYIFESIKMKKNENRKIGKYYNANI